MLVIAGANYGQGREDGEWLGRKGQKIGASRVLVGIASHRRSRWRPRVGAGNAKSCRPRNPIGEYAVSLVHNPFLRVRVLVDARKIGAWRFDI